MLQTLYLTKINENFILKGRKLKLKTKPTTKMSNEDFEKYNEIANQLKNKLCV